MPHTRPSTSEFTKREARYRNWDSGTEPDEGTEAFRDLIQRDPTVCDNCFLNRYETVTHEWWRGSFGWMDYSRWIPRANTAIEVPADTTAQGTRLACANCGHRNSKHRPIPKHKIPDRAENLSQTLDLKEITHCRQTLFAEVDERNTCENQGRQDSHVFAPAVRIAINRG